MTAKTPTERIGELRREIDAIDAQIVALLDRRAETAMRIGTCKREAGIPTPFDAAREQEVVQRITSARRGPFPDNILLSIYHEILAACRNIQIR